MLKGNKYIQNVKRIVSLLLTAAILTNTLYGCGFDKGNVNDAGAVIPEKKYNAVIEHNEKLSEQTIKVSSAFDDLKSSIKYGQLDKENHQLIEKTDELRNCLDELEDETDKWIKAQEKASKSFSKETRRLFKERTKKYKETVEENRKKAEDILAGLEDSIKESNIEETEGYLNELEEMICPDDINTYGEDIINNADDTVGSGSTISVNNEVIDRVEPSDEADIVMLDELKAKTHELSTPLNVYNFLRNNINTEFYFGERKGVNGTYDAMAGNDYDQAGLLIAMLRYLGYEAEYVRGTARFTAEQAVGLTGASDIKTAADVMAACGTPVTLVSVDGEARYIDAEHVWVRANIPYTDYRGALPAEGDKVWLDLDTSVKMYERVNSICDELKEQEIQDDFKSFIEGYDYTNIGKKLELYAESINSSDDPVFNRKRIVKSTELAYLPSSLQYSVQKEIKVFSEIDEAYKDTVSFSVGDTFLGKYSSSEMNGKSIILSFKPAGAADEEILDEYGLFEAPAYSLYMKPVLIVDEEIVAEGNEISALTLGTKQRFRMVIHSAGSDSIVDNDVTTGSMYAVTLDNQNITARELNNIYNGTAELKSQINEENVYSEEYLGKYLALAGKLYFAQVDLTDTMAADIYDVVSTRTLSEGITGYEVKTRSTYGVISRLSYGSLFIDVDSDVHSVTSLNGDDSVSKKYMLSTGILGSLYESVVWEELTGEESISTISILAKAQENDIDILNISTLNLDSGLNELHTDETTKQEIIKAVNEGKTVIIPTENTVIGDWHGTGYILLDRATGAGAYMISGGLNGGCTKAILGIEELLATIGSAAAIAGLITILVAPPLSFTIAPIIICSAFMIAAWLEINYLMWSYYMEYVFEDDLTAKDISETEMGILMIYLSTMCFGICNSIKENTFNGLYDKYGNYTGGRTQEELNMLASDPAHAGSTRPIDIEKGIHERDVGLGLEERGDLKRPIVRDMSGNSEFIDGNGQAWDVKSFNSNYKPKGYNLDKAIEIIRDSINNDENVIIDRTNLSEQDFNELINAIKSFGFMDRVLIW